MGNYWMLQDYFTAYLRNVRGLSDRSIGHYYDALNLISRFLCERHLIQETIFEVADLSRLEELREILYKDREFVGIDEEKINAWVMEQSKGLWGDLNNRKY